MIQKLLLIVLALAVPIGFYAGGVVGFTDGYNTAVYHRSADAGITAIMLRHLRS